MKKLWDKVKKSGKKAARKIDRATDAEISAEEVIETEIYPAGKPGRSTAARKSNADAVKKSCGNKNVRRGKLDKTGVDAVRNAKTSNAAKKPASERTRPTNPAYTMIDPSDGSADAGKS